MFDFEGMFRISYEVNSRSKWYRAKSMPEEEMRKNIEEISNRPDFRLKKVEKVSDGQIVDVASA